ncbi:hypothetical protein BDV35DRAFT_338757 [Aspergillus flavus]|uniref:Uncharacterized protein n=1 Tax=Aspergillus flavus TaxID=5059 RepID=A0A5N6HDZ1_ASPFL|nr:hypothetical protein BDV35DRAFT_338757 [Aspergillus flavus]
MYVVLQFDTILIASHPSFSFLVISTVPIRTPFSFQFRYRHRRQREPTSWGVRCLLPSHGPRRGVRAH